MVSRAAVARPFAVRVVMGGALVQAALLPRPHWVWASGLHVAISLLCCSAQGAVGRVQAPPPSIPSPFHPAH
jgi:hypothetical protein